jgi:hypothetical protein
MRKEQSPLHAFQMKQREDCFETLGVTSIARKFEFEILKSREYEPLCILISFPSVLRMIFPDE